MPSRGDRTSASRPLINALCGRKALARTSRTPGRTQELIFFTGPRLTIVDMPGYGYAAVSKSKVQNWTALIHAFLRGRGNLARVYLAHRRAPWLAKATDDGVFDTLHAAAMSFQVVLTKADQIGAGELAIRITDIQAAIAKRPSAFPEVLATSARSGDGIADLRAWYVRLRRRTRRLVV